MPQDTPTIKEQIKRVKEYLNEAEKDLGRSKEKIDIDYIKHLKKELAELEKKTGGRKSKNTRKSRKSRKA